MGACWAWFSHAAGGSDDGADARQAGDRDTAQMLDALERQIYTADEKEGEPKSAPPDAGGAADVAEGDHTPLTSEEVSGVFGVLDEIDPGAAASLRREWGSDAAANLTASR